MCNLLLRIAHIYERSMIHTFTLEYCVGTNLSYSIKANICPLLPPGAVSCKGSRATCNRCVAEDIRCDHGSGRQGYRISRTLSPEKRGRGSETGSCTGRKQGDRREHNRRWGTSAQACGGPLHGTHDTTARIGTILQAIGGLCGAKG